MIFVTSSGSTYELDEVAKRIRWLSGPRRHHSFPPDRQWRSFVSITYVERGSYVVVTWSEPTPGQRPDCTVTSTVRSIRGQRAA